MDDKKRQELQRLLKEASAITDEELRDVAEPPRPDDTVFGELDMTERRIYTLILLKLGDMEALTSETRRARLSDRLNDLFGGDMLRAFVELTNEQILLNSFLGYRIHRRLGIPEHKSFAVRKGWQIIEVTRKMDVAVTSVQIIDPLEGEGTPEKGPTDLN